jgi:hypothetical protein
MRVAETSNGLITVAVTRETRRDARILAAIKDAPLSEVIAEAIRAALDREQGRQETREVAR